MDKDSAAMRRSNIVQEFHGAHVLVTGGTGFMGHVLMEKLLRSCQIGKLYIIARPKKGLTGVERCQQIFGEPLYERMRHEQPHFMNKVVIVAGDFEKEGIGLNEDDRALLIREVNIIFHCAATVRFDANLSSAISINVAGTKYMLDLAKEMPHLKAFVHFSTAYSQCPKKEIGERFYSPTFRWTELLQLLHSLDNQTLEIITPIVIGDWPNTYTFTKAVTEDMIKEEARDLPIAILRPSIVMNTLNEPVVGWINNLYSASGIVAGAGVGLLKSMYCDGNMTADVVPVDMAINSAIAVAWDLAQKKTETKQVQFNSDMITSTTCEDSITIYNYVSSVQNPLTWFEFKRYCEQASIYPSFKYIWHYYFTYNKYKPIHNIYIIFLHLLPAMLADIGARMIGKEPRLVKTYQKVHKLVDVLGYFSNQQWIFRNDNVQNLWKKMSPQDKRLFAFDITVVDWQEMFHIAAKGIKVYILNEPVWIEEAVPRQRRLKYLHYTVLYLFRLLVLYVAYMMARHYWTSYKDILLERLQ